MATFDVCNHWSRQSPKLKGGHWVINSSISAIKRAIHFCFAGVSVNSSMRFLQRVPHDLEILLKQFSWNFLAASERTKNKPVDNQPNHQHRPEYAALEPV